MCPKAKNEPFIIIGCVPWDAPPADPVAPEIAGERAAERIIRAVNEKEKMLEDRE